MIVSHEPKCLQGDINVFICLLRITGLKTNISKSKKMTCQPGSIWSGMSVEAFTRRSIGEVANYHNHLRCRI